VSGIEAISEIIVPSRTATWAPVRSMLGQNPDSEKRPVMLALPRSSTDGRIVQLNALRWNIGRQVQACSCGRRPRTEMNCRAVLRT